LRKLFSALLYVVAITVAVVTIARPFFVTTYPPITDLPFHASETSIFRHYFDPSYHFEEQFEIAPLEVPYLSSYVLGALLMTFLPTVTAVKTATVLMLMALPVGLGTLAWGMRKSPLLGLAGAPFAWCHLTHWGFINFVSAIGMFAAVLGLTLRVLDKPSRRSQIALALTLVLLFFTHVFRLPFAIAGVVGTTALMYPVVRRVKPVLWPMAPALVLFAIFWILRPPELSPDFGPFHVELGRIAEAPGYLVNAFEGPDEKAVALRFVQALGIVAIVCAAFAASRFAGRTRNEQRFALHAALVPLGAAAMCAIGYLTLPIEAGLWWYIYPREATCVAFFLVALIPNLPEERWVRAALVGALAIASLTVSSFVAGRYRAFDDTTRDFVAVSEKIPKAPKLLYLVFDHDGSDRAQTPYIHLPAWVQAEKGGWLSFHFAMFGASPVRYREGPDAVVPPPVPRRWEWTPDRYDHAAQSPFFDWFLVRSRENPAPIFQGDAIVLETHRGTWWLFRRQQRVDNVSFTTTDP
jgi:hypothetical protein